MTNVFFGVGHGYGGTHLLTELLNLSEDVDCKHERRHAHSVFALFDKYQAVYAGLENPDLVFQNERQVLIDEVLESDKRYGEVNGILSFFIEAAHKRYPDAKFVYLTRDPRQQIISMFNTGMYDDKIFKKMRKVQLWMLPRHKAKVEILRKKGKKIRFNPKQRRQKFISKDELSAPHWDRLTKLEKCAWSWKLVNREALKQIKNIPEDRVFIYKFEDMIAGRRLEELYEFLDIPKPKFEEIISILSVKHNKTPIRVEKPFPPWGRLDLKRKELILNITSEVREELGYE